MNIDIKSILKQLQDKKEHIIITHELVIENDELVGKTDIQIVVQDKTLHLATVKCENYGSHGSHGSQSTRNPNEMGTFDRDPSREPSRDPQKDGSQGSDPREPSCDPQKDGSHLWVKPEILKNQGVEGTRDPRDPCDPQKSQIKRYGYVNGSEHDVYYDGLG